jgi:proteasome lid subunit RPN8/RPN11
MFCDDRENMKNKHWFCNDRESVKNIEEHAVDTVPKIVITYNFQGGKNKIMACIVALVVQIQLRFQKVSSQKTKKKKEKKKEEVNLWVQTLPLVNDKNGDGQL